MTKTPCFNAFGQCHFTDGCDSAGGCRNASRVIQAPAPGRPMRPTEILRFLERTESLGDGTARRVRVLQQAWAPLHGGGYCEWRDVPLVVEEAAA